MPIVPSREFFADPVETARAHPCPALSLRSVTGDAVLVRDPDAIWHILVTDAASFRQGKWKRRARRFVGPTLNTLDGPVHRERRLLLQPALERRRVALFEEAASRRTVAAIAGWPEAEPVRLRSLLDPLSLTIAGDVLLGVDLDPVARSLAEDLSVVMTGLARFTPPLPGTRAGRALRRVHGRVDMLLSERGGDAPTGDLAGILLGAGLPRDVVVGEITAFLLAAVDEPPSGLAAIFYLLARHPDVEQRLATSIGTDDALAEGVIAEALRLLPPARHIDRMPLAPTTVAGLDVDPETNVLVSPTVTHLDEAVFAEPDRFDPDRWSATPRTARTGYLPFGAGAHSCIGEHIARLVMTTVLIETMRSLTIDIATDAEPPIPGKQPLVVCLHRR